MKLHFSLFVLFFYASTVIAQTETPRMEMSDNNLGTGSLNIRTVPKVSTTLEGSPMLFKRDGMGFFTLVDGRKGSEQKVNYNLVTNETIATENGKLFSISSGDIDSLVLMYGTHEKVMVYRYIGGPKIQILEVLNSGIFPLYKHIAVRLVRPNKNPVTLVGSENYTLQRNEQYYVFDNNKFVKLPRKKKKILSSPLFSDRFKDYCKELKPKLKREEDIISFFQDIDKKLVN